MPLKTLTRALAILSLLGLTAQPALASSSSSACSGDSGSGCSKGSSSCKVEPCSGTSSTLDQAATVVAVSCAVLAVAGVAYLIYRMSTGDGKAGGSAAKADEDLLPSRGQDLALAR
jgi:hypothetical protein